MGKTFATLALAVAALAEAGFGLPCLSHACDSNVKHHV
jgi:hypothetical protein